MKKRLLFTMFCCMFFLTSHAQLSYSGAFSIGYLGHLGHTIRIDPSPAWKGYYLPGHSGWSLSTTHGFTFLKTGFAGAEIEYVHFKGVHGMSGFMHVQVKTNKKRLSPLIYLKAGYNHVWNQYEGGTGGLVMNPGMGIQYAIDEKTGLCISVGGMWMQQSFIVPIRLGVFW